MHDIRNLFGIDKVEEKRDTPINNLWECRKKFAKDGVGRARLYKSTPRARKQTTVEISNWRHIVDAVNRAIEPLKP
jgi:hypothetical protein